jgi:NAD(P)-dependent dehydrogenase (short-subunit alcohol dehydrogenase family)
MKVGVIGTGNIGGTLARKLKAAGHGVLVANSRGRERVSAFANEIGAPGFLSCARVTRNPSIAFEHDRFAIERTANPCESSTRKETPCAAQNRFAVPDLDQAKSANRKSTRKKCAYPQTVEAPDGETTP